MIYHVQGNLLTSDCNFIAHQCNCLGAFGGGIAGQIRTVLPEMYKAFKEDTRKAEEKLGGICYAQTSSYIGFNLYGQYYFGGRDPSGKDTIYPALTMAFDKMMKMIPQLAMVKGINVDDIKIGVPYLMGCGLAGGDWKIVKEIIEFSADNNKLDIHLYEYTPE